MAAVRYHLGRFPPDDRLDWPKLIPLIGPTAAALARYDGAIAAIPNPVVMLAPLTTREAVLSSRIEGTQATVDEVLQYEAGREPASPERRNDIHEVLNYRAAMREAEALLKKLPLSQRVIKGAHAVLLRGVRGEGKAPGAYRRIPNWIGRPGCTLEEARFVPVDANDLPKAMDAWERYIHEDAVDKLVQLAILHAEFEALHPFLDGNGRLGRMFVPLFLWQTNLIRAPTFYISAYFEARREAYYDGLHAVSRDDAWTDWCKFFLEAIKLQAEDNLAKTQAILDLYGRMKVRVIDLTRSQYAIYALDWAFSRPIFRSTDFLAQARIPEPSARRLLKVLRDNGPRRGQFGRRPSASRSHVRGVFATPSVKASSERGQGAGPRLQTFPSAWRRAATGTGSGACPTGSDLADRFRARCDRQRILPLTSDRQRGRIEPLTLPSAVGAVPWSRPICAPWGHHRAGWQAVLAASAAQSIGCSRILEIV